MIDYKWSTDYKRLVKLLKEGYKIIIKIQDEYGEAFSEGPNEYSFRTVNSFENYLQNRTMFLAECVEIGLEFVDPEK